MGKCCKANQSDPFLDCKGIVLFYVEVKPKTFSLSHFIRLDVCGWPQRVRHSESPPHQSRLSRSPPESEAHQRTRDRCWARADLVKCHRGEQRQMKKHFCPLMPRIVERICQETETVSPLRPVCARIAPFEQPLGKSGKFMVKLQR